MLVVDSSRSSLPSDFLTVVRIWHLSPKQRLKRALVGIGVSVLVGVTLDPSMTYLYLRLIGKQSTDLTVVFVFPWLSLVVLRSSVEPSGWLEKLELELCPKEKVRNSVPPPLGIWRKEWNNIPYSNRISPWLTEFGPLPWQAKQTMSALCQLQPAT